MSISRCNARLQLHPVVRYSGFRGITGLEGTARKSVKNRARELEGVVPLTYDQVVWFRA